MKIRSKILQLLFLTTPLVLSGCIFLTADALQSLKLYIKTGDVIRAGKLTEIYSAIYPTELKLKNNWVKILGRLEVDASDLPSKIQVDVVSVDSNTERIYYRFKMTLKVKNDGTFSGIKKFKKNLRAETLQSWMIKSIGADIDSKTKVAICIEVVKKKGDASKNGTCTGNGSGTSSGNVVTVEVRDNSFVPQSVQINPGDTVRWVLTGSDLSHTTTAMDSTWNSGFAFQAAGATFEQTFTAGDNNQTFEYSCSTHATCCQMQGSIQVGENAPAPRPGY